jgi:hypothetical protein
VLFKKEVAMPGYPKMKLLHEICFESVLKNMENLWCDHFLREMNQTHWLFVEGIKLPPKFHEKLCFLYTMEHLTRAKGNCRKWTHKGHN